MSQSDAPRSSDPLLSEDECAKIRAMVKRSVLANEPATAPRLLPSVQRKIRERSKGRFFSSGWSTAHSTTFYVIVSLAMLAVLAAAVFGLGSVRER